MSQIMISKTPLFLLLAYFAHRFILFDFAHLMDAETVVARELLETGGLKEIISLAAIHLQPPLDFLLEALWLKNFGETKAVLKLYPLFWGAVLMLLGYYCSWNLYKKRSLSLLFSLLLGFLPPFVLHSFNARPIILSSCLLLFLLWARESLRRSSTKKAIFVYALSIFLYLSSVNFQPVLIVGLLTLEGLFSYRSQGRSRQHFLVASGLGCFLYLPFFLSLTQTNSSSLQLSMSYSHLVWPLKNLARYYFVYFTEGGLFIILALCSLSLPFRSDSLRLFVTALLFPFVGLLVFTTLVQYPFQFHYIDNAFILFLWAFLTHLSTIDFQKWTRRRNIFVCSLVALLTFSVSIPFFKKYNFAPYQWSELYRLVTKQTKKYQTLYKLDFCIPHAWGSHSFEAYQLEYYHSPLINKKLKTFEPYLAPQAIVSDFKNNDIKGKVGLVLPFNRTHFLEKLCQRNLEFISEVKWPSYVTLQKLETFWLISFQAEDNRAAIIKIIETLVANSSAGGQLIYPLELLVRFYNILGNKTQAQINLDHMEKLARSENWNFEQRLPYRRFSLADKWRFLSESLSR